MFFGEAFGSDEHEAELIKVAFIQSGVLTLIIFFASCQIGC